MIRPPGFATFTAGSSTYACYPLHGADPGGSRLAQLPFSLRILLENLLRHENGISVTRGQIEAVLGWQPHAAPSREIAFTPARVLLQDFTGVPALVDLAAMRDAMAELGGDPRRINPLQPVELVVDHSLQVDAAGSAQAMGTNADLEFARNRERYAFLRWGQRAFDHCQVIPPNTGIVHQVNLELLARVVFSSREELGGHPLVFPDTLVGTDSHTTMVNALGVLGWGVGGIEAEAAMLGQPVSMLLPQVVGVRVTGCLREGVTATDLVLTVAEQLRERGVVGKFVEFCGPGLAALPVADRASIANMAPEYGATCAFFPADAQTLRYLRLSGRPEEHVQLVEAYLREQGLFVPEGEGIEPEYSEVLELDLARVEPSIAGPRRPQDRIPLSRARQVWEEALRSYRPSDGARSRKGASAPAGSPVWGEASAERSGVEAPGGGFSLGDGAVVIAALTSCTNTSNPAVMIGAGLLARKAVERGLRTRPWVKTSLAPGSRVVSGYLQAAGLTPFLEQLGFHTVGYGCTTCIGNSGPLSPLVVRAIEEHDLVVCAVLSGNRNFEGRINSHVRANYLASPPLVVAYALAGRIGIDFEHEAIGEGDGGRPVYLREIWPSQAEVEAEVARNVRAELFLENYADVFSGDQRWQELAEPESIRFAWEPESTYVRRPPYFDGLPAETPESLGDIRGARALVSLGNSITTDHISPAGTIGKDSPAGRYLMEHGVMPAQFNSYGARRGNHEVMVRGTFANIRLRNFLAPGREGGWTVHFPSREVLPIYDAAMRYKEEGTPLVVLAGKEYGAGSSRDWAAKGPRLLGIRAVLAESFERIHRSNLVGMGICPLQFLQGQSAASVGLCGQETFDFPGLGALISGGLQGGRELTVVAHPPSGPDLHFNMHIRIDTPQEVLYFRHGGILPFVLRHLLPGRDQQQAVISLGLAVGAVMPEWQPVPAVDADEQSIESFPASDPPAF